jgi:hypothetical protein
MCFKQFCHSSSLSRHKMQAHLRRFRCTLCNKQIASELNVWNLYSKDSKQNVPMACCWVICPIITKSSHHQQRGKSGRRGNWVARNRNCDGLWGQQLILPLSNSPCSCIFCAIAKNGPLKMRRRGADEWLVNPLSHCRPQQLPSASSIAAHAHFRQQVILTHFNGLPSWKTPLPK